MADDEEKDVLRDACGVVGVMTSERGSTEVDVSSVICLTLVALQHRGQESAGIVTSDGNDQLITHKGMGLVSNIFNERELARLKGYVGVGHTRYSTAGSSVLLNCQPFVVDTVHGQIALGHNGELVNAGRLRQSVMERGVGLSSQSDSELIMQLLTMPPPDGEPDGPDWPARIANFMSQSLTAYSLVIMAGDALYAVRDPFGNRPLCIGQLNHFPARAVRTPVKRRHHSSSDDEMESTLEAVGWVVASESCAFLSVGATYMREVLPGEIVCIRRSGVQSVGVVSRPVKPGTDEQRLPAFCIFEYVYFSRPDSIHEGQQVYSARQRCGRQLAKESAVEADIVSTVPESATPAAMSFAEQAGIPFREVLTRNRYVGRTFILPSTRLRRTGVTKKFGVLQDNFYGKRVILVDDSIVRGTTIGAIVGLLKSSGAKEVHVRIASPPLKHPCFMGINIPTHNELIANSLSPSELAASLGADSLVYLSIDGLVSAVQEGVKKSGSVGHCTACLTGDYPVELDW